MKRYTVSVLGDGLKYERQDDTGEYVKYEDVVDLVGTMVTQMSVEWLQRHARETPRDSAFEEDLLHRVSTAFDVPIEMLRGCL